MSKAEARYRRIEVAMWGHHRFRYMSRPEPCGQFLWLYLLTSPDTGMIPGLFRAGEATLAEGLGWPLGEQLAESFREQLRESFAEGRRPPPPKTFRAALAELEVQGLVVVDSDARVVWIPGAIEHHKPKNPNIVTGWARDWKEIPDCPLKAQAWEFFRDFLDRNCLPSIRDAFRNACPKPFSNHSWNSSGNSCGNGSGIKREERRELKTPLPPVATGGPHGSSSEKGEGKRKRRAKERQPSPEVDAAHALVLELVGVDYPEAAWDQLRARLREGLSIDDALAYLRWAAAQPWEGDQVKLDPLVLFRQARCASGVAKAKAAPGKRRPPPQNDGYRDFQPEEAL